MLWKAGDAKEGEVRLHEWQAVCHRWCGTQRLETLCGTVCRYWKVCRARGAPPDSSRETGT